MKRSIHVILAAFLLVPALVYGDLFGPDNYEECVEEHVGEAHTDRAASALRTTCRLKFSKDSGGDYEEIYDCNLKHLPEVKSERAVGFVRNACAWLNDKDAKQDKAYKCILDEVIDAKTDSAAYYLYKNCFDKYK